MQILWQDLRYGARMLFKNPGFTLIAVITLALGIGANTAIFSVVNGVLLRPLNYQEPERILTILNNGSGPLAPANFLDLKSNNRSFEKMAAAEAWSGVLTGQDTPEFLHGLRMGEDLFDLLGVPAQMGRSLQAEDFQPGKDHVLVLSHKLWQRSFGGAANIVGQQVQFSGESYTIIGVMPPQFQFPPFWSTRAELWAPLDLRPRATSRGGNSLRVFARLKPGVTVTQAQADIAELNKQLVAAYPESNTGLKLRADFMTEKVVGNVRPALLILLVTVGMVLLIACANVACLLLARAAVRQKEVAVRAALGASRWRIFRQMLTESLLLAVCGAIGGSLIAVWGVSWLTRMLSGNSTSFAVRLPRVSEIQVDSSALLFTFIIALLTSILFGLIPALAASKPELNQVLKDTGRGNTGGHSNWRSVMVVAELALSLVLLVGAGLLMNSFLKLQAIDPGFDQHNLLTATVSLSSSPQNVGPSRELFYRRLNEELKALPGVQAVSEINHLPLAGDVWGRAISVEGRPLPPPGQSDGAVFRVIRPDYFQTMGIPLKEGREFTERDGPEAERVAIINESLARNHWPTESPLGKRFTPDDSRGTAPVRWFTIVGVVKNVKQSSWVDAADNEYYLPFQQEAEFYGGNAARFTSLTVVIRTALAPESMAKALTETVKKLDRNTPVSNVISMEQIVANALWQQRFNLQLIGLFAALAVVLAAIGLYGVMSYSVAQRTHEVGLRMALGAGRRDVLKLLVGQGMKLALFGVGLGLLASLALTRLMANLLFGVSPTDPFTFGLISLFLTLIALVACFVPATRATKVDPMIALRAD